MFACLTPMLSTKYDYGHVYGHIIPNTMEHFTKLSLLLASTTECRKNSRM